MKESDLRRLLPDGIADFNDWHAQISKYNTPLMRHLDSLDIPEKKENWTRTALYGSWTVFRGLMTRFSWIWERRRKFRRRISVK